MSGFCGAIRITGMTNAPWMSAGRANAGAPAKGGERGSESDAGSGQASNGPNVGLV